MTRGAAPKMAARALALSRRAALRPAGPGEAAVGRRGARALRRSPLRVLPAQSEREAAATPPREPPAPPAVQRRPAGQGLWYEKAAAGDRRLGRVVTMARSRKLREQHGAVLLEGPRLIRDALQAGAAPRTLFFSAVEQLRALPEDRLKGANLVKVKFEDIKSWSDLVTPQGLLGIFSKPDYTKMAYPADQLSNSLPLVLICDNIRDPGNLGTILRSAAGAGCEKVLLTKGCVDAWEPKVLRAGMGAHFRVPIIANLDWESLPKKLPAGVRVCVADNRDAGMRTELEPAVGSTPGTLESHPGACPGAGEAGAAAGGAGMALAAQQYHESWARPPVAVVVGGETQGLSAGALRLAAGTGGRRLVIPVAPGVDSLNSAVAAAILLFEGKRQLCGSRQRDDERQELPVPG